MAAGRALGPLTVALGSAVLLGAAPAFGQTTGGTGGSGVGGRYDNGATAGAYTLGGAGGTPGAAGTNGNGADWYAPGAVILFLGSGGGGGGGAGGGIGATGGYTNAGSPGPGSPDFIIPGGTAGNAGGDSVQYAPGGGGGGNGGWHGSVINGGTADLSSPTIAGDGGNGGRGGNIAGTSASTGASGGGGGGGGGAGGYGVVGGAGAVSGATVSTNPAPTARTPGSTPVT